MINKHIILIGFMCSGKTTMGKQLAPLMRMPFIDIDDYITDKYKKSIGDIFSEEGESMFREKERGCLIEILSQPPAVISAGGGTPCFFDNMQLINNQAVSVYLKNDAEIVCDWLNASGQNQRPLLKGKSKEELLIYIRNLLLQRKPYYEQAQITAPASTITAIELINEINIRINYPKQ